MENHTLHMWCIESAHLRQELHHSRPSHDNRGPAQAKTLLQQYISAKDLAALKVLLSSSQYLVLDYTREHQNVIGQVELAATLAPSSTQRTRHHVNVNGQVDLELAAALATRADEW